MLFYVIVVSPVIPVSKHGSVGLTRNTKRSCLEEEVDMQHQAVRLDVRRIGNPLFVGGTLLQMVCYVEFYVQCIFCGVCWVGSLVTRNVPVVYGTVIG